MLVMVSLHSNGKAPKTAVFSPMWGVGLLVCLLLLLPLCQNQVVVGVWALSSSSFQSHLSNVGTLYVLGGSFNGVIHTLVTFPSADLGSTI